MTEAPERETALDQLVAQLRTALKRETTNIIEIGNLLIEIRREHVQHGEWKTWLAENFDLSYRSARRYESVAEYVKLKSATVALFDFENLSPTVLYELAAGRFSEQKEAAILAATRERRVDWDAALAICDKIDSGSACAKADAEAIAALASGDPEALAAFLGKDVEDPESTAILDGPPPAVPPPAPNAPPIDFALQDFDETISALKGLMTKPATQFVRTVHNADDLELVGLFIRAVIEALKCPTP